MNIKNDPGQNDFICQLTRILRGARFLLNKENFAKRLTSY